MKRLGTNGTVPATVAIPVVAPASNQRRMLLSAVQEYAPSGGEKITLFSPEGWGKTTWAALAEKPIFINAEDGLKGVKRNLAKLYGVTDITLNQFPAPQTWADIFDAVEELRTNDHVFKTLVIDTVDWTQHLCENHVLKKYNCESIEDVGKGYGKGFSISSEEWRRLLMPLNRLRVEKNMTILLLSHHQIKTFSNPIGENYDRYEMKLDRRISTIIKEWSDCVLFGNYDVAVDVKKGSSKGKGHGNDRVIFTGHSAAFDAKNRYGLPDQISADPKEFWGIVKGGVVK